MPSFRPQAATAPLLVSIESFCGFVSVCACLTTAGTLETHSKWKHHFLSGLAVHSPSICGACQWCDWNGGRVGTAWVLIVVGSAAFFCSQSVLCFHSKSAFTLGSTVTSFGLLLFFKDARQDCCISYCKWAERNELNPLNWWRKREILWFYVQ